MEPGVGRAFEPGLDLSFHEFLKSIILSAKWKTQVYTSPSPGVNGIGYEAHQPPRKNQRGAARSEGCSLKGLWSEILGWYFPQMLCLQAELSSAKSRCKTVCLIGENITYPLCWLLCHLRMREEPLVPN